MLKSNKFNLFELLENQYDFMKSINQASKLNNKIKC